MSESQQSPKHRIANEIAAIYKAGYGRGPTRITVEVSDRAVVCILEDVTSPDLESLARYGANGVAASVHLELQNGMAPAMVDAVEVATGRRVRTYVPGLNAREAATTDIFLLDGDAS